ncbi:MAG TPA: Rieske 2Fe-2S domain-containing protein [Chloroflexota bacterium]|nr:Rieske 2Fe-2S domain-containing protein [Chloroflexota bacterium]
MARDIPSPVATGEGQGEGTPSAGATPKQLPGRGLGRRSWDTWPAYDAAELGLREYWYPVVWSGQLGRKPVAVKVLGEDVMLLRDNAGKPRALANRCPHRGVPLALGRQEFPGTWSCWYHGWTYDLASGAMVACLTDGPDSPLTGKVHVKTYPVEERIGLVWLFLGDGQAPPIEDGIPAELLQQPNARAGRITVRPGNWRLAAENGFDEGHAKFLHRSSLWTLMRRMPAYSRTHVEPSEGDWITRKTTAVGMEEIDYPGLGKWPRRDWWRRRGGAPVCSIRLPGCLRIAYPGWTHYEWYVASDADGTTAVFKWSDAIYPNQQFNAIMYSPQFAKSNTAKGFMTAYVQGVRDYNDVIRGKGNMDEFARIGAKYLPVKDPAIYKAVRQIGINPDGKLQLGPMQEDIDFYIKDGLLKNKPDLSKLVDNSFVDGALKELGPYKG